MPLVILLIGGAIAVWSAARERYRSEVIRQQVAQLCQAAAEDEKLADRINPTSPAAARQIEQELKRVCTDLQAVSLLEIEVIPGDDESAGRSQGLATHRAVLRMGDVPLLGLRVQYRSENDPIIIVGSWRPREGQTISSASSS